MIDRRPRIAVLGLGGTIAMMPGGHQGGVVPALPTSALLDAVPDLAKLDVELAGEDVRLGPSASLTLDDVTALAATIRSRLDAGAHGVVVVQGTDTIEESAYLLDLLHAGPGPVVVTGAMRSPAAAGADGPANILAAVQVAASSAVRDQGCVVVLADEVHAARYVRKTHATSLTTFASPAAGPLAHVVEGGVQVVARVPGRFTVPADALGGRPAPRVGLVTAALGDDGEALDGAAGRWDGVVVAGFGVGHVPEWWLDRLASLATVQPVVLASRTGSGPVLRSTYGFPGSEASLVAAGLIPSGLLDPFKARVLLHVLLSAGADRVTIEAAFGAAGGYRPITSWPYAAG